MICENCATEFTSRRPSRARFCSATCRRAHWEKSTGRVRETYPRTKSRTSVRRRSQRHSGARKPTRYAVVRFEGSGLTFVGSARTHDGNTAIREVVGEDDGRDYTFMPLSIWARKLDGHGRRR